MAGRLAEQQAKAEERAAEEGTRALEREMRARERIRDRSASMAGRYAEREANAEIQARKHIGSQVGGAALHGAGRVIGGIASIGGMAMGALGAFGLADAVKDRLSSERLASKIVNQSTIGGVAAPGADRGNILDQAAAVAVKTGMSKEQILGGTSAYMANARSSDFKGAMGNMDFFAKMAKVTGADINSIASGAGKLQSQNANLGPKEMQSLLMHADAMSKTGTMSFEQAIESFGKVGSTRTSYRGDTGKNQAQLLGLAQIAGSGGNADEVGTFISALAGETHQANKKWKKKTGHNLVDIDGAGQMASPVEVVEQVLRGTGGNIDKVKDLYGRRGSVLFGEVAGSFQAASAAAGGGAKGLEAGIAAVKANIAGVTGAAESPEDLEKEFAQTMSSSAEKFSVAVETIREKVEAKLVPFLDLLADKLGDPKLMANVDGLIEAVSTIADFFAKNPFTGIGALVLASISKSLADAMIGEAVKQVLVRVAAGESVGGALKTSGAGGALSLLGGAAMGVVGVGSAFLTQSTDKADSEARVKSLLGGAASPAEAASKISAIQQALATSKKALADPATMMATAGLPLNKTINAVGGLFGKSDVTGAEAAVARSEEAKAIQRHTAELEKAMAAYTKVLNAGSSAGSIASADHPALSKDINSRTHTGP